MARPKAGYFLSDGKRVPGTTTITGRIHWAWDLGMQGKNYREVRDEAADAGTLVHAMIEAKASGEDPLAPIATASDELRILAKKGYEAYVEWAEVSRIEIVEQEIQLVSEEYRYGGTLDAIGYCNRRLSLLDWKSGGIWPEHLCQIAAYRQLWHENHSEDLLESFHLARFNKETGDFSHHMFTSKTVDLGWNQFKLLREAYELDKKIKKAVK
jgi:hypothetical protein